MADLYPFNEFNFGGEVVVEDKYSSSNNVLWNMSSSQPCINVEVEGKAFQISGAEEWGDSGGMDMNSFCSVNNFGFFPDHEYSSDQGYLLSSTNQQKEQLSYLDYGPLDNLRFDMVVSPQPLDDDLPNVVVHNDLDVAEPTCKELNKPSSFPLASLDLLNNYGNGFKRFNNNNAELLPENDHRRNNHEVTTTSLRKLSTEDVMRMAGARLIQSASSCNSEFDGLNSSISHPYAFCFSGLTDDEKDDVELAESLLACAEKIGFRQFERASKLLHHCESMCSKIGNPVKRVVSYFAEALRERINRETGRSVSSSSPSSKLSIEAETVVRHYRKYIQEASKFDPDKSMLSPSPTSIACHEELPFAQVVEFAGIQAIAENVADSKKIHIIDLGIRKGAQWTILMQALESRSVELLKITAIGTTMRDLLETTGKRLTSFAQSMKIPFCYKIVMVSNMLELKEDLVEKDPEETIAVYSKFALRAMIPKPEQIEALMKWVRNLKPVVMVVTEVEANHNATSFVKRFTEALFYFSAFFDCVDTCMTKEDPNRMVLESLYFSEGIRNIVAREGEERKIRNVKIEVWRAFFGRFGMVEEELSMSSLYQAELVAKRFACGEFCTFEMNGNCLLSGWKGTPLQSLSVWKFL